MINDEMKSKATQPTNNWYLRKREPFYRTGFNEHHIPNQSGYDQRREKSPRLDAWENPQYTWPPVMPRPTMHRGKTLLNHLESEEKQRQLENRDFDLPDYRTGDVVKFTMYGSLSEKKEYDYSGVVIRKQAPNSINARCTITFGQEGVRCMTGVSLFSPMLKSFEIQRYGSNQLRKKLNHIMDLDISAGRLQEPI